MALQDKVELLGVYLRWKPAAAVARHVKINESGIKKTCVLRKENCDAIAADTKTLHFFSEIPFYLELKGQDSYKKGQDQLELWPTDQDKSPFCEACSSSAREGGRELHSSP